MFLSSRSALLRLPKAHASLAPSSPPASSPAPAAPERARLRPGTRAQNAFPIDPFSPPRPFTKFDDSPFAVQEYVAELVRRDAGDVEVVVGVPDEEEVGEDGEARRRELVDEDVWVAEQIKRITLDQHAWLAALVDVCTPETCPSMTTTPSWLFVCAAHATPPTPPCSAISYMVHTSDGAQALLTSPRYFPSRLHVTPQGKRLLAAVARRLYRTFAHAYLHHHALFVHFESETALVRRFGALNRRFALIEEEALVIPEFFGAEMQAEREGEEEGEPGPEPEDKDGEDEGEGGVRAVEDASRDGPTPSP